MSKSSLKGFHRGFTKGLSVLLPTVSVIVIGLTPINASHAFLSFGGVNGATETTQWLNNFELVNNTQKTAMLVSTQFKQYMTELQQWNATLQNIANLPSSVYSTLMGPYNTVTGAAQNFQSGIHNLSAAANNYEATYRARLAAAGRAGIEPSIYFKMQADLAREKGGVYKKQQEDDIRAIDNYVQRAAAVKAAAAQISGLQGNVESLGLLNQQINQTTTELMEIRGILLRDSSERAGEKRTAEAAKVAQAEANRLRAEKAKKDSDAMKNETFNGFKAFWEK